ncbi:unnamed protein product [Rotaria socialis]|uniref:Uncharacterized protein n=1 Tax=Rotaria socialis TaxID=392032 RepID=A0A821RJK3_9BILA|nr:unnamed protein product [Rotaria socialis]
MNFNNLEDDLDKDQLYSEFCDIKCLYDNLNRKNIKLRDQVKSFISSKRINFSASKSSHHSVVCDDDDSDKEEVISSSKNQDEDLIRSDKLWAYQLNINPN